MQTFADQSFIMSDPHFYHNNIIRYCNRPYKAAMVNDFSNLEELERMNTDILAEFNKLPAYCEIWLLGDIWFVGNSHKDWLMDRFDHLKEMVESMTLHGKRAINLVLGNHDRLHLPGKTVVQTYEELGFDKVYDTPIVVDNSFILSHEPVYISKGSNLYNIYGHTHDMSIEEDYFTFDYDNYAMQKRVAKQEGLPEPKIIQKWPDRLIDLSHYYNCCYDKIHGFINTKDLLSNLKK